MSERKGSSRKRRLVRDGHITTSKQTGGEGVQWNQLIFFLFRLSCGGGRPDVNTTKKLPLPYKEGNFFSV